MTKIHIIRHGVTFWNKAMRYQGHTDIHLTDEGIEQAQKMAQSFDNIKLSAIYCSDLARARTTAERLAKRQGLEVIPQPAFREIFFGQWEGLTYEQIQAKWPEEIEIFFQSPGKIILPEGEGFKDVAKRAIPVYKQLLAKHEDQEIAIVAHGGTNRVLLCDVLGLSLDNCWRIKQDNTAVNTVLYLNNQICMIERLNDITHLKA